MACVLLPREEVESIIKKTCCTWNGQEQFKEMTKEKGIFYSSIIQKNSNKPWISSNKLLSKNIKTISHLRKGHAFNKKFLHLIGTESTPFCFEFVMKLKVKSRNQILQEI